SQGSVCLVINSNAFDESDYIRDYKAFLNFKQI
ncbi:MAG TPA: WxcM-like domain-containing protein, partial [Flavobacteriales bacterium]|nr:WxcM-like domain-containing protein [Flavobacteriales bacterium]